MLLQPRHLVLPGLLLALAGLETARTFGRLAELRETNRLERADLLWREQGQLADRLRRRLEEGSEHAAYVARAASVRELLRAGAPGGPASELAGEVLPYLVSFGAIDGVRVFAADGAELFRAERIGQGVGVLGAEQLGRLPADLEQHERVVAGDAVGRPALLAGLAFDTERVEVPERDRRVLRYVAPVRGGGAGIGAEGDGARAGLVVVTVYAAPLLDAVRRFEPLAGAGAWLLDEDRTVVAASETAVLPAALAGLLDDSAGGPRGADPSVAEGFDGFADEVWLAAPPLEGLPFGVVDAPVTTGAELILGVFAPASTLDAESGELRQEVRRAALTAGVISLGLLGAALWLARTSQRELRLREAQRHLLRERDMEGRLHQAERLSALGLLTAGVAHEINNPLEGVGNYLKLLERGGTEEQRSRWLERVGHGFERIRDIVRQLSGFGLAETPSGVADLERVAERALELVELTTECKALEIDRSGLTPGLAVPGDAGRLEQVVLNLLLNAGRATNGTGRVRIASARSADERSAELSVEDDGPGFAPEVLARVFDPFFTAPPAGTDVERSGTGLGLSVSYGIARAHGGELVAENRERGGARLVMRLPLEREPNTAGAEPSTARARSNAGEDRRAKDEGGDV